MLAHLLLPDPRFCVLSLLGVTFPISVISPRVLIATVFLWLLLPSLWVRYTSGDKPDAVHLASKEQDWSEDAPVELAIRPIYVKVPVVPLPFLT